MVYASGRPFRGWRVPPEEVAHFLTAPWPRYITLDDLLVNVGAYIPIGFLLALALRPHVRNYRAVLLGIACGIALSVGLEYMQTFLPGRIASNVDVITNSLGTIVGALAAPLFGPTRQLGQRLFRLRDRWFAPGMFADAGLVLVALWLLTALHPTAQLFGTGDVRATLDLPIFVLHKPHIAVASEAAVVCLNLLGIGLLVASVLRPEARYVRVIGIIAAVALLMKAVGAAGVKPASLWSWLTPGVTLGLLLGAALLHAAGRLRRRTAALCGAFTIAAAVIVINAAPGNPYHSVPPQFLTGSASHFLSYSGMVRALSEVWPLLAMAYLTAAALGLGMRSDGMAGRGYRL